MGLSLFTQLKRIPAARERPQSKHEVHIYLWPSESTATQTFQPQEIRSIISDLEGVHETIFILPIYRKMGFTNI